MTITGTAADADVSYTGVTYTTSSIGGTTANINVRRLGTSYEVSVIGGGSGYSVSDTLNILGTELGGATPTNDAQVTIATVGGGGDVLTATISGTAVNTQDFANISNHLNQLGSSANFDVTVNYNNTYTVAIGSTGGTNYNVDQQIKILGSDIGNGASPANDITITITGIGALGLITGISSSGTAADATTDYVIGDRLQVAGAILGGVPTTNDADITISSVSGTGVIQSLSISGTAPDASATYPSVVYTTNTVGGTNATLIFEKIN